MRHADDEGGRAVVDIVGLGVAHGSERCLTTWWPGAGRVLADVVGVEVYRWHWGVIGEPVTQPRRAAGASFMVQGGRRGMPPTIVCGCQWLSAAAMGWGAWRTNLDFFLGRRLSSHHLVPLISRAREEAVVVVGVIDGAVDLSNNK